MDAPSTKRRLVASWMKIPTPVLRARKLFFVSPSDSCCVLTDMSCGFMLDTSASALPTPLMRLKQSQETNVSPYHSEVSALGLSEAFERGTSIRQRSDRRKLTSAIIHRLSDAKDEATTDPHGVPTITRRVSHELPQLPSGRICCGDSSNQLVPTILPVAGGANGIS